MSEDNTQPATPKNQSAVERFRNWLGAAVEKHEARYYHGERDSYRWVSRIVGLTSLVAIVAGAFLLLRPPVRHYLEWRDNSTAQSFLAQGDEYGATIYAQQALKLNPEDLTAAKLMAQISAKSRSPDELLWLQRVETIDPSIPNKLALADTALRCQGPPFPLATQILSELATGASTNAVWQMIAGRLAVMEHHPEDAEAHFVAATTLVPTNVNYAVNLAVFRLGRTNESARTAAREQLRQYRADPVSGPMALRALVADRLAAHDLGAANNFSTQLLANPRCNLGDHLQYLSVLRQAKSAEFGHQFEIAKAGAETSDLAVAEASHWMLANNLAAENLDWLTNLPADLQSRLPVKLALVDAYEANGLWEDLSEFASRGNWGELEYYRFAEVSHAAANMGLQDVARINWGSAVNEATGRQAAQRRLLELAARWNLKPQAEDLLARLVHDFPEEQDAVETLTQVYLRNGATRSLNQLFARLAPMYPTNTGYQNNLTATALLLRTNLNVAEKAAAAAYARTPETPQVVITYAYSLHLQQRDAEGITALKKLKTADLEKPSPALYYGLLLNSAGKPAEAASWLKIAKTTEGSLLPEERELLASALAGR